MPQETHDSEKATSPSPAVQSNIDQAWGQQGKATTDPAQALKDKHTNNPVNPAKP